MREIGGYIEFEHYRGNLLHENAIALNCGRNCLAYLFRSKEIKRLKIPYFICGSIYDVCDRERVEKSFYHIGLDFRPVEPLTLGDDEWLYLVNFYGQLNNTIVQEYIERFGRVIVDQANDYFAEPVSRTDTIYTCRKWFGVADGAFLYTNKTIDEDFPRDESYNRVRFLLGRFERTANEFYKDYVDNNKSFATEPIKRMSLLTENLLRGIDYKEAKNKRKDNYSYLHEKLGAYNLLKPKLATFMYPFMIDNGAKIKKELQAKMIYIPTLWPTVFKITNPNDAEYKMADNILPLPIDQRYDIEDMDRMVKTILEVM